MQINFANIVKRFRKCESGATLVEYGVAVILAVMVGGAALTTLAGDINLQLGEASSLMNAPAAP